MNDTNIGKKDKDTPVTGSSSGRCFDRRSMRLGRAPNPFLLEDVSDDHFGQAVMTRTWLNSSGVGGFLYTKLGPNDQHTQKRPGRVTGSSTNLTL
ncbi:AAEL017045-PA [Aedes aegypti]|uniref:AAEL017045-PA n=1 Tax=Aedes aegypti TaxID=7159 RepID=J9HFJ2_AEDAE|nr:AAEL017045-PA [Aedes aegypti]